MRWFKKWPFHGQLRACSDFLLLPKTIEGETRWLEFATWKEVYCVPYAFGPGEWRAFAWQ